jgi:uncharacterized protein YaaR (DUF327 family)
MCQKYKDLIKEYLKQFENKEVVNNKQKCLHSNNYTFESSVR